MSYHSNDANISYRGILLEAYNNGERYNPAPDDWYLTDRVAIDLNHEWLISDTVTMKTLLYWSEVSRDYWRYGVDTAASNSAGHWVYTDNLTGNNRSFDRIGIESRLAWSHQLGNLLADSEFRIVGSDTEGDARVMEISSHPFFVGTLFVPQARSTKERPHPLVTAFIQSI